MTSEGQSAMAGALVARTFELLTELALLRLSGAASNTPDYLDLVRRLDAQILNLTVREARVVLEIGQIIEEKLP